jgi:hypothetical protein
MEAKFIFIALFGFITILAAMTDSRFTKLEKRVKELELELYNESFEDEDE